MRTLFLSIFVSIVLLVAEPAFGTNMGQYNYSNYHNPTTDGVNLYLTTVTDGSTSCTTQALCKIAKHHANAYARIASVTQSVTGPNLTPDSYLSEQAAVTLTDVVDGEDYPEDSSSEVDCTIAGLVFYAAFQFDATIRNLQAHIAYHGPVPPDEPREYYPDYTFSPVSPECSNTTTPAVNPSLVLALNAEDQAFDVIAKCPDIFGLKWCIYPVSNRGIAASKEYVVDPGPGYCDPGP